MRLVRFNRHVEAPSLARLGVALRGALVADLRAGYAAYLTARGDGQAIDIASVRIPPTIAALIAAEALATRELRDVVHWLEDASAADPQRAGLRGEPLFTPLQACRLHAPVRSTNLFIALTGESRSPSFTMKPSIAVVGPARDIRLPKEVSEVTCAPGLAVVIGRACRDVDESEAADVIAGYFVMTNVSKPSSASERPFDDGMYETFAPSGPWLVSRDEIPDPTNLSVEMRVNGTVRRRFSTAAMRWTTPQLIASLSCATLQAGDVIWVDAPDASRDDVRVRVDDHVETIVEGVGMIRNRVVR